MRVESMLEKRLWVLPVIIMLSASCGSSRVPASLSAAKINDEISAGLLGNWEALGVQKGQTVPDFILFSQEGKAFNLSSEVKNQKPIVLISGSYTCDVSRANMKAIKSFQKKFSKDANFFLVYTIDAHPYDVASPYSAERKVWVAKNNIRDNIKAKQPKTYQERVALAQQWINDNSIEFPVLIDAPDNFYWKKFGQAPNMVYIITPEKEVLYKQAWFNEEKLAQQLELLRENGETE